MKKRLFTLLLALTMLASLVIGALPAMAAEGDITLRLHYAREDEEYTGWHLWLWDNSATTPLTPPYEFVREGKEMVATVPINAGTMEVGYIVYLNKWEKKDINEDQFIDIAGIMAGTVDVYVKSGIKGHEIVLGDDIIEDTVIVNASYKEENSDGLPQVIVKLSNKVEDYEVTTDTFSVYNQDGAATITAVKNVNSYYYLTLSEKLDPMRGYLVGFEDKKMAVSMPDVYSTEEFEALYTYTGNDLGATYTAEKTALRLWAPLAQSVSVNLYASGDPETEPTPVSQVPMTQDVKGTWICELPGDRNRTYYTYAVTDDLGTVEVCDPYARTTGVNGQRAMILDLKSTDPEGWDKDENPNKGINYTDAVIYELHVRDLSAHASSGIASKGKYPGVIERGTVNPDGIPTGLDHIVNLGVTHVHLLPIYDYGSVDESKPEEERGYNWGYDPVNYNVPEGSYATDPYNGEVRVREVKQMVMGMHDAGLSVIMDVVYNHVYDAGKFCFNQAVPGYFTRPGSNASGCGNDVASERSMVSKYIVDSVNYWADEYHIDGFRFDLVGILDTDTINEIVKTVHEKHPDVIFYGEGWTMNTKLTKPGYTLATQFNSTKTPHFAFFSDTIRNLVKGGTYNGVTAGYISGGNASVDALNQCFMGMPTDWCQTPSQSINYISCHDNNTLYDHITMVAKDATEQERIAMNKLGASFYLMAQGIPFFQAGEEILRTKPKEDGFDHNSYCSPDEVNSIKWDTLSDPDYMGVYKYYQGLIAFRQAHPALRLTEAEAVKAAVQPVSGLPAGVVAYNIKGGMEDERAEAIFCAYNAGKTATTVTLPDGNWKICVNGEQAGTQSLGEASGTVEVPALSAMVLTQGEPEELIETPPETQPTTQQQIKEDPVEPAANLGLVIALVTVLAVILAVAVVLILKKKG